MLSLRTKRKLTSKDLALKVPRDGKHSTAPSQSVEMCTGTFICEIYNCVPFTKMLGLKRKVKGEPELSRQSWQKGAKSPASLDRGQQQCEHEDHAKCVEEFEL